MKTIPLFIGDELGLRDVGVPRAKVKSKCPKRSTNDPEFARSIKIRRAELDISQAELSEAMGVAQPTLSRFESGAADITPEMRQCINAAFDFLKGN